MRSVLPLVLASAACGSQPSMMMVAPTPDAGSSCSPVGVGVDAGVLDAGPVVQASTPPPPLSGGTLAVSASGHYAVAADPDRDVVWIVDLASLTVSGHLSLTAGDRPGRVVEDAAGHMHVVLRNGGSVITLDPATGALLERRAVCPAPRGAAYDATGDAVYVACAGGEFVTLPAAGGPATRTLKLDADLRDVVVDGDSILVSRFRNAEVLVLDRQGAVQRRVQPQSAMRMEASSTSVSGAIRFDPTAAWRMVGEPGGGALMLHERAQSSEVQVPARSVSYYAAQSSDGCAPGIVHDAITEVTASGPPSLGTILESSVVLPIDLAVSPDGRTALVTAGGLADRPRVELIQVPQLRSAICEPEANPYPVGAPLTLTTQGRAIAAVFAGASSAQIVVQTREPATLVLANIGSNVTAPTVITLASDSHYDTGFELFHTAFGAPIACAGCHPEGGDDGHTWTFPCEGARRTQSLRGGLLATAPFHWDGHLRDFHALTDEVFGERLAAPAPTAEASAALGAWLDAQRDPTPSPAADPSAAARGAALFNDPVVACATCHAGPHFTNNTTVDVGTGGPFQVSSLVGVGWRPPYLHNGCAATLADRFGPCGGGDQHGHTSQLTPGQISDLVSYLQTL